MPSDRNSVAVIKHGQFKRATPPFNSLSYLKTVLQGESGTVGTKFVIGFHYPLDGHATTDDPSGSSPSSLVRMSTEDRRNFYQVIENYDVIALLHGHRHSTYVYSWCGIPVFNIGSPLMSYRGSNTAFDSSYAVFNINKSNLDAASVSWNFASADKSLVLGAPASCSYGPNKPESKCWHIHASIRDIIKASHDLKGQCDVDLHPALPSLID